MIEKYDLDNLCKEYNINSEKMILNNKNVLTYGEYQDIKMVLEYLVNELKIDSKNIEKCPSILCFNVNDIKSNYEFLKKNKININKLENCLHVLSTKSIDLKETYHYVINKYGKEQLNKTISILRVSLSRIKNIEKKFSLILKDKTLLTACASNKSTDEIEKIIQLCQTNKVEITNSVFMKPVYEIEKIIEVCKKNNIEAKGVIFKQTADEIEKIIKVCRINNIEISGSVFKKKANEIEKIIEVCRINNIEITGRVFLRTADEIEKIINLCIANKIEIKNSIFVKNPKQLKENIEYIKNTFGEEYLINLVINKNIKNLKKILPYLESLGVLPIVKNSTSILELTLEEIIEKQTYIESIGENFVVNNKFNPIFSLSKNRYKAKIITKHKK